MMNVEKDYSEYGIWNGQPTLPVYNRQERREYIKEHKKDKYAKLCPHCNNKALFITDDFSRPFCELCGKLRGDSNE